MAEETKVEAPSLEEPIYGQASQISEDEVKEQDLAERKTGSLRIVSDGENTAVFDDLGRQISWVKSAKWSVEGNGTPRAVIELYKVPVDIITRDARLKYKAAWGVKRTDRSVVPPFTQLLPLKKEES